MYPSKRNEDAANRPFARMHIHFVLVRGERWAGNGSAFRPKTEFLEPIQKCKSETLLVPNEDLFVLNEMSHPLSKCIGCTGSCLEPHAPKRPRKDNGQDAWSKDKNCVDYESNHALDSRCRQVAVLHNFETSFPQLKVKSIFRSAGNRQGEVLRLVPSRRYR